MRAPANWLTKKLIAHFHKKYKPVYRRAKILFAIDIILVSVAMALAGLASWTVYEHFWEARILAITAQTTPTAITSGAPVTFTIWYENKSRETLDQVMLAIRLPPNFELLRSFPASLATRTSTLPLGTLAAGERGMAKITGRLWGAVGTPAPVLVTAAFTSPKRNRRLVAFEKFEFPIQNSVLASSLIMPDRLIAGQAAPFEFSYKNNGTELLPEVLVRPLVPQGATIRSDHNLLLARGVWSTGEVSPGAHGMIRGTIELPASLNTETQITMQSSIIHRETELLQDEVAILAPVFPTPLLVSTTTLLTVAKPGTEIPVDIRLQNIDKMPIREITVTLAHTSPAIDTDELNPPINIGDLLPNEAKTISYLLPLREQIDRRDLDEGDEDRELSIIIRAEATGLLEDDLPISLAVRGSDIQLPLETAFSVSAAASFYTREGDQIGRGPLPPTVGKTTKYWVIWEFSPTTNELEGLLVRAKLPPQVEWTGQAHATTGRAPRYEPETRTVRWTIDHLAPTLPTGESLVARFEVALTPTEPLRGTIPPLLEETSAQAFDRFTETQLSASAGLLTTALPQDDYLRGRIRVR